MNKTKRTHFTSIILATLCLLAFTIFGVAFLQSKTVAAEEAGITKEDVTVYDYYDLTNTYMRELNAENMLLGSPEEESVAFKSMVSLNTSFNASEFGFSILNAGTDTWGAGYCIAITSDYKINLKAGNIYDASNANGLLGQTESLEVMKKPFELEFGAQRLLENELHVGYYVYVKINGNIVLEAIDNNTAEMSHNIVANTTARCALYSTKIAVETVTVYDYYDLTNEYARGFNPGNMLLGSPEEESVAFKGMVSLNASFNASEFGFSILNAGTDTWGAGYSIAITSDYKINLKAGNIYDASIANGLLGQTESLEVMKKPFELEFGAQKLTDGSRIYGYYVYVKVNNATVLSVYHYGGSLTGNKNIVANTHSRCNVCSTKLVTETATEYDVYDLTGAYEFGWAPESMVKGTFASDSAVFKGTVRLADSFNDSEFGFTMFTDRADTFGYGYTINFTSAYEINFAMGTIASTYYDGNSLIKTAPLDELKEDFVLEFGVQRLMGGENCYGSYIFVKVNGKIVIEYNYYGETTKWGTNLVANTYGRCNVYSTKLTAETATEYDFYDLTGLYESGLSLENMVLGSVNDASIALKTNVEISTDFNASEFGFSILNVGSDTYGFGYSLAITSDYKFNLIAGNIYDASLANGLLRQTESLDAMKNPFELEFGAQRLLADEEAYGYYIYVKVNGNTVLEYTDYINRALGKNVIANIAARANLSTTKEVRTFTYDQSCQGFELEDIIKLVEGEEKQVSVSMKEGYILKSVKIGDTELSLVETENGYTFTIPAEILSGAIVIVEEEKSLAVTLPETDKATFVASKTVPYRGTFTLAVTPATGSALASLKVNGVEVKEELTIENGTYTYSVAMVKEAIVVSAEFVDIAHSVTVNANEGGTVTVESTVVEGATLTAKVGANEGYYVSSVKVNGEEVSLNETGEFSVENVQADIVIDVVFEKITYAVTVNANEGGTVTVESTVVEGATLTAKVGANEGYYVSSVKVNGEEVSLNETGEFSVENVQADVAIDVVFAEVVVTPPDDSSDSSDSSNSSEGSDSSASSNESDGSENGSTSGTGCFGTVDSGFALFMIIAIAAMLVFVKSKKRDEN